MQELETTANEIREKGDAEAEQVNRTIHKIQVIQWQMMEMVWQQGSYGQHDSYDQWRGHDGAGIGGDARHRGFVAMWL